jgi:hypothetical protein
MERAPGGFGRPLPFFWGGSVGTVASREEIHLFDLGKQGLFPVVYND